MDSLKGIFSEFPSGLSSPLLDTYEDALKAAQSSDWEKVGLKAGKICEITYSILKGYVDGALPDKPSKPSNMYDACNAFQQSDSSQFPRSVRIQIPRVIIAVYELRNNRAIGHVGGDVVPNEMDGIFFLGSIKWIMAELVRVFHKVDTETARQIVDVVSERSIPIIWDADGVIRVLNPELLANEKVLVVLYHIAEKVSQNKLQDIVEYVNPTNFKNRVLKPLHKEKKIEFNEKERLVSILPPGIKEVEEKILSNK